LPFDPRVSEVVNAQRRTFEALGCITEDADPDFSGADEAFKTLRALSFYQQYNSLLGQQLKRTVVDEIERGARLTGPEIAQHLYVSLNTLRSHTKHIFTKLDVNTRRAAVRRATDLGLL